MAPDFLGEFASSFSKKEGIMKERMLEGKTNPLRDRLEKHFLSNWIQLDHMESFSANPGDLGVAAVDSSVYTNPLSTGGIFYVERRKELVNILSSFFREGGRIIPQMLIITHHTEVEDVADTIYTIRKEDNYSIAEKQLLG